MTITKKRKATAEATSGMTVYVTEAERTLLNADLDRINSHRQKNKLPMSELIRQRLFESKVRNEKVLDGVQASSIPAPDFEALIQSAFQNWKPDPGLLKGEAAHVINWLEQIIIEKQHITQAAIEQTRRDILDLKDDLQTATRAFKG